MPAEAPPAAAQPMDAMATPADPHAGHDMAAMGQEMAMPAMRAAFGPYPMTREASGTSWQPDASPHDGVHAMRGDWTLMGHVVLDGVVDHQSGPRGADQGFVSGMVMGMATGALSDRDTVQLRAMLSPEPLMGARGYPLLLAAGETADGVRTLVDRQHPHDLFMELSAAYSRRVGPRTSLFVYAGLPGEPAFGPPAFMHRLAVMDSPEAPISHHWLDSTHISFGVVTAGVTHGPVKLEVSRFKGREPDQHRWDIEAPRLDSTAVRLAVNPTATLSLQASYAYQRSPEQLDPEDDQEKWSASAIRTRRVGAGGYLAGTLAWGRRQTSHPDGDRDRAQDAWVAELGWQPDRRWTLFGRGEMTDSNELLVPAGAAHGPVYRVGKVSAGAIRDFAVAQSARVGIGGLVARSFTPPALDSAYGGDRTSGMAFVRLRIG